MSNRRGFLKSLLAGGAAVAAAPFVAKSVPALARPELTVNPLSAPVAAVSRKLGAWVKVGNVLVWDPARSLDDPNFNG